MSGRQKALLGVLAVLLVALFVVAVSVPGQDRGDPGARHGLVDRLGALGGERSAVDPGTVSADCADETGRLVFTGSCVLRVADPGGLRTLVLRSPARFRVTAPAPGDADLTIRDDVEPASDGTGAVAKVAVDEATEVAVTCPGLGGCTVTVTTS
ncbi:hypothetical protein F8271_25505 [Micromonospora sp. ALFpr18c]|uniref:hypothetical protein n=1 Tax=unclassified Micromonospora TaxID=2617518 RepID=UPI00124B6C47|nr:MULTISPECIES: hypothetical protein [unclassified Micromonospora]KAB1932278.1 hypothetical protein F8271_25505 [Micromonospora sp. ALFpr18c]MDG4757787.1 hypothetical protein [Micromonospora sp. WMMD710]